MNFLEKCFALTLVGATLLFAIPPKVSPKVDSIKLPKIDTVAAVTVAVAPQPLCTLKLSTAPSEALIYFNDSLLGPSPLTFITPCVDSALLVMKKKGCYVKRATVKLNEAKTVEATYVLLQPATIMVTTDPSGASIVIDTSKGKSPYRLDKLKPADYKIVVTKNNYVPQERTVTLVSGKTDTFHFKLEFAAAYKDSIARTIEVAKKSKFEKFLLGISTGVFLGAATFMVILDAAAGGK